MILIVFVISCTSVYLTGRKQLNLIPNSSILATSFTQYDEFITSNELSDNTVQIDLVNRVGKRISSAVNNFFTSEGLSSEIDNYNWEFNLIKGDEVNAWCMPGGKVVVYTGIMPVAQNESGLAVIMGHEIAHAIAKHGNERMSQTLIQQLGGMALLAALDEKPEETKALWMQAYGVGSGVGVMLPFSRLHESEADRLGLIFMSMAGYNPNAAITFWERMSAQGDGAEPPEFLSTHPSSESRINNIKKLIPEALEYSE